MLVSMLSARILAAGALALVATSGDTVPRIAPVACAPAGVAVAPTGAIAPRWQGDVMRFAEFSVRLGEGGTRVRVVAVRFDPRRVRLSLERTGDEHGFGPWSIADASADARLAMNAGQFTDQGPWGWVVHRGREFQAPGRGELAGAFVVTRGGEARLLAPGEIATARASIHEDRERSEVVEALQSFPMLLQGDGRAPAALCDDDAIDRTHRDARLAIGTTASGDVVVAMTRFEVPGTTVTSRVPIGPTTPEMATLMRELGATRALMLDGGLSAQLLVRDGEAARSWKGVRRVPLALVAR